MAALESVGAAFVVVVAPPAGVAQGWDAADAEAEGWTASKADELVRAANPTGRSAHGRRAASEGAASDKPVKAARGVEGVIELVKSEGVEFRNDTARDAYATVGVAGHRESYLIESRSFAEWVARVSYLSGITPPNSNALKEAVLFFGAKARFEGVEKTPIRRSGQRGGNFS